MSPTRVLVVHADPSIRDLAERALSRLGIEIEVVSSSDMATRLLSLRHWTMVAVDRELPDGKADEIIATATALPSPSPVIIAASANGNGLKPELADRIVTSSRDPQILVGVILAHAADRAAVADTPPAMS